MVTYNCYRCGQNCELHEDAEQGKEDPKYCPVTGERIHNWAEMIEPKKDK